MKISIFTVLSFLLCCLAFQTFHFDICSGSSKIHCIPSELKALLIFKHHLIDPLNRLSSWNSSNPNCCHWVGVVCSNTNNVLQLHLNTSQPIYKVQYYDVGYDVHKYQEALDAYERSIFSGEINSSLVELKHLTHLDLSGNDFEGMKIPSFLWKMTSLTYLNLSDAGFSGIIPPHIGRLSNLLYLDLSRVAYGKIPSQIGNLTNLLRLGLGSGYFGGPLSAKSLHWLLGLSQLQYLDLDNADLSKSLNWLETLQSLPSLMELRLSACMLPTHYHQPSSVNFSSLLTLDLSYIGISSVPQWVFGLRKLVSLELQDNNIQGPIPQSFQNLTLLENVDLSFNSFSSFIPDWLYSLHHLKFLNLGFNNLCGNISYALGNLTSLVKLDLSINQLEGRTPPSLGNLYNLEEINFSYLKLNQQVNEVLEILTPCVLHDLKRVRIEGSQLFGNLTDQIRMFKNVETLDFSNNSIQGALPRSFEKLSSLRNLDLSKNKFRGNPFEVLSPLFELSILSIEDNLFQGVVKEDDLANFRSLKIFSASGNNLTLEVGPNWHPNFQLYELGMSLWQLGPKFPPWIQSQKELDFLAMSNTGIFDSIPTWLWEKFSSPESYLNLSHNLIHGDLANTLENPMSITYIDLSSNHLSGKLPHTSDGQVFWLDLSSNSFSGSMTNFLCKEIDQSMQLQFLNLASNNLSGEIPDCWIKWSNLVDVNLESNFFVGNLPASIGSLTKLQTLHVRNNSLSGIFPTCLKRTKELIFLDLGENMLAGTIPTWVGERLFNLKILRLRSNKFFGDIPKEICAMNFLQDLDLAKNNLSGNIPNCFNHLNVMFLRNRSTSSFIYSNTSISYTGPSIVSSLLWVKGKGIVYKNLLGLVTNVDLSDNHLSGEIPRAITDLDGLIYLNLSRNQLSGQIPSSIGNMRSTESIDFSWNQLSGEIPPTISNLSFLNKLDLSYNHLKGEIPTGTQLQSFEASNFIGNNLCGAPLPINCSPHKQIPNDDDNDKENDSVHGFNWIFVSMPLGFIVGFWVVVAPLFISRSWRYTYYHFLDNMWYKLRYCW